MARGSRWSHLGTASLLAVASCQDESPPPSPDEPPARIENAPSGAFDAPTTLFGAVFSHGAPIATWLVPDGGAPRWFALIIAGPGEVTAARLEQRTVIVPAAIDPPEGRAQRVVIVSGTAAGVDAARVLDASEHDVEPRQLLSCGGSVVAVWRNDGPLLARRVSANLADVDALVFDAEPSGVAAPLVCRDDMVVVAEPVAVPLGFEDLDPDDVVREADGRAWLTGVVRGDHSRFGHTLGDTAYLVSVTPGGSITQRAFWPERDAFTYGHRVVRARGVGACRGVDGVGMEVTVMTGVEDTYFLETRFVLPVGDGRTVCTATAVKLESHAGFGEGDVTIALAPTPCARARGLALIDGDARVMLPGVDDDGLTGPGGFLGDFHVFPSSAVGIVTFRPAECAMDLTVAAP